MSGLILIAQYGQTQCILQIDKANPHHLITSNTGTGTTIALQTMAVDMIAEGKVPTGGTERATSTCRGHLVPLRSNLKVHDERDIQVSAGLRIGVDQRCCVCNSKPLHVRPKPILAIGKVHNAGVDPHFFA